MNKKFNILNKYSKKIFIGLLFVFLGGFFVISSVSAGVSTTSVTLLTPNRGETWSGIQNITWIYSDDGSLGDQVSILLSSGGSYNNLVTGVPITDLSYAWDTTSITDGTTFFRLV